MDVCFIQYRRTLLLRLVIPLALGLVATQSISECFLITRFWSYTLNFVLKLILFSFHVTLLAGCVILGIINFELEGILCLSCRDVCPSYFLNLSYNLLPWSLNFRFLYGDQARFFSDEIRLDLKHSKTGTVAMASAGENLNASQVLLICEFVSSIIKFCLHLCWFSEIYLLALH